MLDGIAGLGSLKFRVALRLYTVSNSELHSDFIHSDYDISHLLSIENNKSYSDIEYILRRSNSTPNSRRSQSESVGGSQSESVGQTVG